MGLKEALYDRFVVALYGNPGHCVGCEEYPNTTVVRSSFWNGTVQVKGQTENPGLTVRGREIHKPTMPTINSGC